MARRADGWLEGSANPEGLWRTANLGDTPPSISLTGDVWVRLERYNDGAIDGYWASPESQGRHGKPQFENADWGSPWNGSPVQFQTGSLDQAQQTLGVAWIGVSPHALNQIVVIWSTAVRLLNKAAIQVTGKGSISGITVVGNRMIITMSTNIAIDGEEFWSCVFGAGSVGTYCVVPLTPAELSGGPDSIRTLPGNQSFPDTEIPDPDNGFPCTEPIKGKASDPPPSSSGDQLPGAAAFAPSYACQPGNNPAGTVSTPIQLANSRILTIARCLHPFTLQKAFRCNAVPAKAFQVSIVFHRSCMAPKSYLVGDLIDLTGDRNLCNIWQGGQYPFVLTADVDCCTGGNASFNAAGDTGGCVVPFDSWKGKHKGLKNQYVTLRQDCGTICGVLRPIVAEPPDSISEFPWVAEDIIKPHPRTIPLYFIKEQRYTTETATVPDFTSVTNGLITNIGTTEADVPVVTGTQFISNYDIVSNVFLGTGTTQTGHLVTPDTTYTPIDFWSPPRSVVTSITPQFMPLEVCSGTSVVTINVVTNVVANVLTRDFFVKNDEGGPPQKLVPVVTGSFSVFTTSPKVTAFDSVITEFVAVEPADPDPIPIPQFDVVPFKGVTSIDKGTRWDKNGPDKTVTIFKESPTGSIKLLVATDCGTSADIIPLLKRPADTLVATAQVPVISGCCTTTYSPLTQPVEDICSTVPLILMSPDYTFKTAGNELACPCYKVTTDAPESAPHPAGEPKVGGPVNPCTIRVQRLSREWCRACE